MWITGLLLVTEYIFIANVYKNTFVRTFLTTVNRKQARSDENPALRSGSDYFPIIRGTRSIVLLMAAYDAHYRSQR